LVGYGGVVVRSGRSQMTLGASSRSNLEMKVRVSCLELSMATLVERSARRCRVNYLV
jgi:hypothetical protein